MSLHVTGAIRETKGKMSRHLSKQFSNLFAAGTLATRTYVHINALRTSIIQHAQPKAHVHVHTYVCKRAKSGSSQPEADTADEVHNTCT